MVDNAQDSKKETSILEKISGNQYEAVLTSRELETRQKAQMYVNLFRQFHVLEGGIERLNTIYLKEVDDDILERITHIPGGNKLAAHIDSLRKGETDPRSILKTFLPFGLEPVREFQPDLYKEFFAEDDKYSVDYGKKISNFKTNDKETLAARQAMGLMTEEDKNKVKEEGITTQISEIDKNNANKLEDMLKRAQEKKLQELKAITNGASKNPEETDGNTTSPGSIESFKPEELEKIQVEIFAAIREFKISVSGLNKFKNSENFKKFLPNWNMNIKNLIRNSGSDEIEKHELLTKFEQITSFNLSYNMVLQVQELLNESPDKFDKFEATRNLQKYEKHLGIFGEYGTDLLSKLQDKLKKA